MDDQASSYRITVTLEGTQPPIWRRFRVAADTPLAQLHEILQEVMGWDNDHLYQFHIDELMYGPIDLDLGLGLADMEDADAITLHEIVEDGFTTFGYEYDFGDSWMHRLDVEEDLPTQGSGEIPIVLAGERACPPEDCGGVWGYTELLTALADPGDAESEELLDWLGDDFDPEVFYVDEANERLENFR